MLSSIRSALFWLHLAMGLTAGLVIFVMALTGTLLAYEQQVTDWADRGFRVAAPAAGAGRLPLEALVAKAAEAEPGTAPSTITVEADPAAPAAVSFGRERTVYFDPYTGAALGESAPAFRRFFRLAEGIHRWLGVGEEHRAAARQVTAACNLGFIVLILSGFVLWLPRKWTRRQVRNATWFRSGLRGKARDLNWHSVLGFWGWVPLALMVACSVVMSYAWANDLLYRAAGEKPPVRAGGGPGAAGERSAGSAERVRRRGADGRPDQRVEKRGRHGRDAAADGERLVRLDDLWTKAERQMPGWRSISLRLPEGGAAPAVFTIARAGRGRPDLRAQLALDRRSGEVVRWEPFASQGPGRRLRSWARWVHTGEAGGFAGQTVAGLASLGAVLLVWTGWAMAWRRFFPKRRRERAAVAAPEAPPLLES